MIAKSRLAIPTVAGLLTAGSVAYLAAGLPVLAIFAVFVLFVVAPAAALSSRLPVLRGLSAESRVAFSIIVSIPLFVGWLMIRRLDDGSVWMDLLISTLLSIVAIRTGAFRHLADDLRGLPAPLLLTLSLIPVVTAVAWSGHAFVRDGAVWFHGLFVVDFGTLVSVVTTVRSSPGIPEVAITGAGPIGYHWLFFAVPAILRDFLSSSSMTNAQALILCNVLAGWTLILALSGVCRDVAQSSGLRSAAAAAFVVAAPFSVYYYQFVSSRLDLGPLSLPSENHLLLAPLSSAIMFGNNSIALAMVALVMVFIRRWNEDGDRWALVAGAVLTGALIGFSATIFLAVMAALGLLLVTGQVRRPIIAGAAGITAAAVALFVFPHLGVLRPGERSMIFDFDGGQFCKMVLFGMMPLWLVLGAGWKLQQHRRLAILSFAFLGAALAIPTFAALDGAVSRIDLSMKIGSMIPVAVAPAVSIALAQFPRGAAWRKVIVLVACVIGGIHSLAYLAQYPAARLRPSPRTRAFDLSYVRALDYVRGATDIDAIVADPITDELRDTYAVAMLGERRGWFPTAFGRDVLIRGKAEWIAQRTEVWRRAVADPSGPAALQMARECEVLLHRGELVSPFWRRVHEEDGIVVFRSRQR